MFKQLLNLLGIRSVEAQGQGRNKFEDDESHGRGAAYNRLRLVLMHDRTQLEPHVLEAMRDELVGVISKYISVDREAIELNLETDPDTNQVALMASIPVQRNTAINELPSKEISSARPVTESVKTITDKVVEGLSSSI
jgi:cell division topological specificity factor